MEVDQSAPAVRPGRRPDRWRENLARGNLAAAIMLLIQYGLGIGVNLYVTLPAAGRGGRGIGDAFTSGPALAVHAVLGLLLILTALSMVVRSVIARHRASIVTSAAARGGQGDVQVHADAEAVLDQEHDRGGQVAPGQVLPPAVRALLARSGRRALAYRHGRQPPRRRRAHIRRRAITGISHHSGHQKIPAAQR